MENIKLDFRNQDDFTKFLAAVHGHNRETLRLRWQQAFKRRWILILRRIGPAQAQVVIMPPEEFNIYSKKLIPRFFNGSIFTAIPKGVFYVFGLDEVLARVPGANQTPVQPAQVEAHQEPQRQGNKNNGGGDPSGVKRRGRPKKRKETDSEG